MRKTENGRFLTTSLPAGTGTDWRCGMAAELLDTAPADKHLLILLTDASPDDSHKILPTGKVPLSRDYDGQVGVEDTADEVRALRRKGIRVAAVFMGENANVPNARAIYGQDLAPFAGWISFRRGGTADPNGDPGAVRLNKQTKQTNKHAIPGGMACLFDFLCQYFVLLHGHHSDAVFALTVDAQTERLHIFIPP